MVRSTRRRDVGRPGDWRPRPYRNAARRGTGSALSNITIIEGIGANQLGIRIVSARIAEIVLRDERAIIPIGVFNPKFGVTLSIPGILYRTGFWNPR